MDAWKTIAQSNTRQTYVDNGRLLKIVCTNFPIFLEYVTPTLNVSRKFSMYIIFSTEYIKIYNIKASNEYFTQQYMFVHSTIQYNSSKT